MRGAGGRGGRVALACITLRVFAGVGAGVCMQDFVRRPTRRWGAADYQSLRAFRRPKLGGLELPGFQDWIRLTCRGAAEDIINESWGFLNECHPHPESLEKHLGAARELSEISCGSLLQLLVIFWRSFT